MKTLILLVTLLGVLGFTDATPPIERLTTATSKLRYAKAVTDESGRLQTIVAETYATAAGNPLFNGDVLAGNEATALLLYAVLYHESGLRAHIERCDCTKGDGTCDNGHAFGLPQLHAEWLHGHSTEEFCADRKLQMQLALDLLQKTKSMCHGSAERWMAAYHSGNDCTMSGYSHNVNEIFTTLLGRAGIRVARDYTGWRADFI